MSHDPATLPGAPADDGMPARTTPTWEMELLISGATVFGLMQLPEVADRLLFHAHNTGPASIGVFVLPLWIYVKSALITLVATFVVHLCLRGYWTALVGLSSVYPAGIRWEQVRQRSGPVVTEWMRTRFGDAAQMIERADNRATRVFGVGVALAMVMLLPIGMVLVLMTMLWAVTRMFGEVPYLQEIGLGLFALLPLPLAIAQVWDRRHGTTAADSRASHLAGGVLRVYQRLGLGQAGNPLLVLFSSNEGNRKTVVLMLATMGVMFAIMFAQAVGDRLGWEFGDYAALPEDARSATGVVLPIHYDSQRGDRVFLVPVPTIPDPVVRGPYLRLFIPYFPRRHAVAVAHACPEMLEDDAGGRAQLDCLARLHAVAIDGEPVAVPFDAAEDPRTGQRGMLVMIPMRDVAPGRHELTVKAAPRPRDLAPDAEPDPPYLIPFWR